MVGRWLGALLAASVLGAGACASGRDVRWADSSVGAVIDVWAALAEDGGFEYRWSLTEEWDDHETVEVTVEGQRDLERGRSVDTVTTTVTAEPVTGTVDDVPSSGTGVETIITLHGLSWSRVHVAAGGGSWVALPGSGGPVGPGAGATPYDEAGFDPTHRGLTGAVAAAASVDRYEPDGVTGRADGTVRWFRGTGELWGASVGVVVGLDEVGRLRHVRTSDGEELEVWGYGTTVPAEEPSPVEDTEPIFATADQPQVVGDWEVEVEGVTDEVPWQVVRAPGQVLGHEVPCRALLAPLPGSTERWDDIDVALEWVEPTCGAGGWRSLTTAVADPAVQVLVPSWAWEATPSMAMPMAVVVSPRFRDLPVEAVTSDGERTPVPLTDGAGVVVLPGNAETVVVEVALGGDIVCETGLTEADLEDARYDGYHVASFLIDLPISCAR